MFKVMFTDSGEFLAYGVGGFPCLERSDMANVFETVEAATVRGFAANFGGFVVVSIDEDGVVYDSRLQVLHSALGEAGIDSDIIQSEVEDFHVLEHESPSGDRFTVRFDGPTWSLWWNGGADDSDGVEGEWRGSDLIDAVNICRGLLGFTPDDYADAWAIKQPMMELVVR